jgi:hypothetical protein
MERIHPQLVDISVALCRDLYGYQFARTARELSILISDEFECICLPEDVSEYCVDIIEEEENILIYQNL